MFFLICLNMPIFFYYFKIIMENKNEEKEQSIEDRLIYNNNKLVADKIRKTLLNIRNLPGISAKRWIWELIQNAKDVPNKFGKVEIKIELTKNSLIFSHNGSYFTIDNILGILNKLVLKIQKIWKIKQENLELVL